MKKVKLVEIIMWTGLFIVMLFATIQYGNTANMLDTSMDFSADWTAVTDDGEEINMVDMGENVCFEDSSHMVFIKQLPSEEVEHAGLMMTIYKQNVTVYLDNEEISRYPVESLQGKETYLSKGWMLTELPKGYGGKQLKLRICDSVSPNSICIDRLWLGNTRVLIEKRNRESLMGMFVGIVLMLLGVSACLMALVHGNLRTWQSRAKMQLGFLACCMGAWYYLNHCIVSSMLSNSIRLGYMDMLLSYLACWLMYTLFATVRILPCLNVLRIMGWLSWAMAGMFTVFGLLGMRSFGYWMHGFTAIMILTAIILVCALIFSLRKKTKSRLFLIFLLIFVFSTAVDRVQEGFLPHVISGLDYSYICVLVIFEAALMSLEKRQIGLLREIAEKKLVEKQVETQCRHYQSLYQAMDNVRVLAHDTRFHLLALRTLLLDMRQADALTYINKMIESARLDEKNLQSTGNPVLDAILAEAQAQAKQNHTTMKQSVVVPSNCEIRAQDWCAIMGNALDNAIKAARYISDGFVDVEIKTHGNMIYGAICNSAKPQGSIVSDVGLHSMERTIKQYEGELHYSQEGNVFTLRFLLMLRAHDQL